MVKSIKRVVISLMVLMVVMCTGTISNVGHAMSYNQMLELRLEIQHRLEQIPEVTYDQLLANPDAYRGKTVKFYATCVGTNDPQVAFHDNNGNWMIIRQIAYYKLLVGTDYTVAAVFQGISRPDGEPPACMFTVEDCHLPFMSEYGM